MIDLIDKKHFISFLDFVIVEHDIYFSNDTFNALVQANMDTNQVVHMEPFKEAPLNKAHLHTGCIQYKNQIFFYSITDPKINVFDLGSREQFTITLKDIQGGFAAADLCGEELYFLPVNIENGILRYEESEHSLIKEFWFPNEIKGSYRYCRRGLNTWIAYELDGKRCFLIDLNKKDSCDFFTDHLIYRMDYCDGNAWYVSRNEGQLYCFSLKKRIKTEVPLEKWVYKNAGGVQYAAVFAEDEKIFLISGDCGHICAVDQENKKRIPLLEIADDTIDRFVSWGNEVKKKRFHNKLIIFFQQRNVAVQINLETMNAEVIHLDYMNDKTVKDYIAFYNYSNGVIMQENSSVSLEQFIQLCIDKKED